MLKNNLWYFVVGIKIFLYLEKKKFVYISFYIIYR